MTSPAITMHVGDLEGTTKTERNNWTATVTGLSKSGLTYASTDNHDPDSDSNGTSITVNKP